MPNFYAKYRTQLERYVGEFAHVQPTAPIPIDPVDQPAAALTRGGQVLAALPGVSFRNLFNTFNQVTAAFTWDPSARGSYTWQRAMEALDGTRTSGECKILATALLGLWVFPPPFGLGQAAAAPRASLYRFENYDAREGFVAHHPVGGVRGLRPNIMHPHGNPTDLATRQPLYQWGDHKVVFYDGRLWDPSYQCVWQREEDMVAFEFTGQHHYIDGDAYEVRVVTPNPARGWLARQMMFMRFDLTGGGWKGPYRAIA